MPARSRVAVAAGVLRDAAGRVLIARRADGAHAGGQWEFPGGKIDAGEAPIHALGRELMEELGIRVHEATPFMQLRHDYPERSVELHVFLVGRYSGTPVGLEGQPLQWLPVSDLGTAGLLEADLPIAAALAALHTSP